MRFSEKPFSFLTSAFHDALQPKQSTFKLDLTF
jgi:hypothetical protein